MRLLIIAAIIVSALLQPAVAENDTDKAGPGDVGRGEKAFLVCRVCHQIGPNARNAVGPVLNGIIGRQAGTYPGFAYSPANKDSGITWSAEKLEKYLDNPQKVVPGTKMAFPGVHDRAKVDDIIAYLSSFNDKGEKSP